MPDIVYNVGQLAPGFLVLSADGSRAYYKELIYEGDFFNLGGDKKKFSVTERDIDEWIQTGSQMLANGLRIPLPLEHTEDPSKNMGFVLGFAKTRKQLRDGRDVAALLAKIQFRDPEAEKLALSTDVSIFSPEKVIDGMGRTYKNPVKHVALTNYPVIPDLAPFRAIVASMTSRGDDTMLRSLAEKLGIAADDSTDEAALEEKILQLFTAMKSKLGAGAPPAAQPDAAMMSNDSGVMQPGAGAPPLGQPQFPGMQPQQPQFQLPGQQPQMQQQPQQTAQVQPKGGSISTKIDLPTGLVASVTGMVKRDRGAQLDQLVNGGHITRATRDELAKTYCEDAAIQLSMGETGEVESAEFDALISALSKNQAVRYGERTGPQSVRLSNPSSATENPLVAMAEARQKEYAAANG